jgi:benzodiazapine receptor
VSQLSTGRVAVGVLGTALVAMYAVGSGLLVATDTQWYRSLLKPAWQPPGFIPALIWPYNFALLITATWIVASRLSGIQQLVWLISLALSVVAALSWAWLFFSTHALFASGVALVLATLFSIPLLVIAFRVSVPLGVALAPYQLWLALATSLAFGYASQ